MNINITEIGIVDADFPMTDSPLFVSGKSKGSISFDSEYEYIILINSNVYFSTNNYINIYTIIVVLFVSMENFIILKAKKIYGLAIKVLVWKQI